MDYAALRNFKDFLQLYNAISETCFLRCINNFGSRELAPDEAQCVDFCAGKHVKMNHKVMQVYMQVQPLIAQKRMEEMQAQQAALENAKKADEQKADGPQQPVVAPIESGKKDSEENQISVVPS